MQSLKQVQISMLRWPLAFITLALFNLSSCCTAKIPTDIKDEQLYYLKGLPTAQPNDATFAVQMWFLSAGSVALTKAEWDAISQGKACMDLSSFDDFNAEIAKLCSETTCNYAAQKKLASLMHRLHRAAGL